MCSGPFRGAQGHSHLQTHPKRRSQLQSLAPRSTIRSCQTQPVPDAQRRFQADTPPPAMRLPACQSPKRLVPFRRPRTHPGASLRSPHLKLCASPRDMRRATMAGLARYPNNLANCADALGAPSPSGVARRRRTRIATADEASLRGKAAWQGRTRETHGPTGVLRQC